MYVETSTATPSWVVVLFAGNDGALHLSANGPTTLRGNFLIRTASYWAQKGDAAVLIDTPSDHVNGVDDEFRLGTDALTDVEAAVAALRKRFPSSKIALVGTSRGTVSVGNALERNPGLADAFVLTSPVSIASGGQPGVSGLIADGRKAQVLVVSNRHDACPAALFDGAERLAGRNHFDLIAVASTEGGGNRHADCNGRSPHGFLGIEDEVLGDIDRWLAASVNPAPPSPPISPHASP
jgi:pimeloyl-ACP methyl ester carboxylesterase